MSGSWNKSSVSFIFQMKALILGYYAADIHHSYTNTRIPYRTHEKNIPKRGEQYFPTASKGEIFLILLAR